MSHPADFSLCQACNEYEPILSVKNFTEGGEPDDPMPEEEISCDSCIHFNSFECKIRQ